MHMYLHLCVRMVYKYTDIFISILYGLMLLFLAWLPYISSTWYGYLLPASVWLNVKVHFIFIFRVICAVCVCVRVSPAPSFYGGNFDVSLVSRHFSSNSKGMKVRVGQVEIFGTFSNVQIDWAIQSNSILSDACKRSRTSVYHSNEIILHLGRRSSVCVSVNDCTSIPELKSSEFSCVTNTAAGRWNDFFLS